MSGRREVIASSDELVTIMSSTYISTYTITPDLS
jgi:hypothetical protein